MRTLIQVIITAALITVILFFLFAVVPVLGLLYSSWKVQQAIKAFPDSLLIERSNELPGVKVFLEKYPKNKAAVIPDYHLDVWYLHTANATANESGTLAVRIKLDTGHPEHYTLWCHDKYVGARFPLDGEAVLQAIKDC